MMRWAPGAVMFVPSLRNSYAEARMAGAGFAAESGGVKPLRLIILSVLLCATALAQNLWQPSTGPYEGPVHDWVETGGGVIFAASQNGGVFKSTDGVSFTAANTGLPTTTVRCLALNAAGDLFCGTGAGPTAANDGVYKLTGAAGSWAAVASLQNAKITALARNPVNGDILAITGTSLRRMAGGSGSLVTTGAVPGTPTLRGLAVRGDGIIFLASDAGVYFSTDTIGTAWTAAGSLGANNSARCVAINASGVIAVGLLQNALNATMPGGVVASSNGGASWSAVALGGATMNALTIDAGGRFIAGGANVSTQLGGAAYSTNGTGWTQFTSGLSNLAAVVSAVQTSHGLYLGANGAWRTTDSGANWSQIADANGLLTRASLQVGSLIFTPDGGLYAGLFNDGVARSPDGAATWSRVNGGLASRLIAGLGVDDLGEAVAGLGFVPGGAARLTGNGAAWSASTFSPAAINGQTNAFLLLPNNDLLTGGLYTGGIFRSTNHAAAFVQDANQGALASGSGLFCLLRDSSGNLYAGTETNDVIRLASGATTWTGIGPTGANWSGTTNTRALAVNALGQILCGKTDLNGACIHRYSGAGVTWTPSSTGITAYSNVFCFALASNGDLFAGSDRGLFKSTDNGATWSAYQSGLAANPTIQSLAIGTDGYLYAGLNVGGGVWKSANQVSAATAGVLQFQNAAYSVNENGGSVVLTVARTGGSAGAVGVSFASANGSATAGADYTATSGALAWANGDAAAKTITVPILDDAIYEGNETFAVTLSAPSGGASLGANATATVTIVDNETPPTYALTVNSGSGSGAYTAGTVVTISANAPPAGQVFDTWSGATVANAALATTTLTMPAASTSVTALYKFASSPGVPSSFAQRGVGGGGALFSPAFNPANLNELWTGCDLRAFFHSTNLGQSWTSYDFRSIQANRGSEMQFTSSAGTLYTLDFSTINSTDFFRPVKSTDGGATWTPLASDPTGGGPIRLSADPASTQRLVLSDYSHIYFSSNGGTSWTTKYTAATGQGVHVAGVFWDSANIYIGTNDGLLVSTNNGASFALAAAGGLPAGTVIAGFAGAKGASITRFYCTVYAAADVYAGLLVEEAYYAGSYGGTFTLDLGAANWVAKNTGIAAGHNPLLVAMTPANIDNAYLAGRDANLAYPIVYKTTNGGAAWTQVFQATGNANITTGWQGYHGDSDWYFGELAMGFTVARNNLNYLAITDFGFLHISTDGGATWRQTYVQLADQNAAGAATPKGRTYHSDGLENTTCWGVTWADANNMFASFSDIHGIRSTDGGNGWSFNYTGHTDNTMYRSVRAIAGTTLYAATSSVHDIYQTTRIDDTYLSGTGKVLASADLGATWMTLHDFQKPVVWVATDPGNANRLYASVVDSAVGGIYVSSNINLGAASTWTLLAAPSRTQRHPFNVVVLNDGTLVATYCARYSGGAFTASSGVFTSADGGATWSDRSAAGMLYYTKDIVIDPHDAAQNTWFACVWSGYGGAPNGLGGLYRTTDRGVHWTRINAEDRVSSGAINPGAPGEMYFTTESDGLWYCANANAATPSFTQVASYPYQQPERVFFNPYAPSELWVTSFGNALRVGTIPAHGTVRFAAASASVSESAGSATISVTRTGGTTGAVSVSYATSNGTATAGADYTATSGTLSWADADSAAKAFSIPITNDTLAEGNETLLVTLSAPTGGAALGAPATMTLTILDPPIDAWRFANFGANANVANIAGDLADPDRDGIANLLEYALGLDPQTSSAASLPALGTAGGYLTITFTRPLSATDVSYIVQVTSDLATWNDGSLYTASGDVPANAFTTQLSRTATGGIETITVRDNTAINAASEQCLRLKITRP